MSDTANDGCKCFGCRGYPLSNPPTPRELMACYRGFGGRVWEERRRLFVRLFAAAGAAMEHHENPQDLQLLNELVRVGQTYRLFN